MNAEPKVFISYRREETAAYAGRLHDAMAERFGESNVFMDVDLKPGVDFIERITLGSFAVTGALIGALIGGLWLPPRPAAGLVSGGVAAALAVAPFVGGVTTEWVFCLNAAAIAAATLATLVAIDARRPTTGRGADARSEP